MFTPAIRAMQLPYLFKSRKLYHPEAIELNQPWRCLWRGSLLQITRTTPLRRTILQLRHTFLTDAWTFICFSLLLSTWYQSLGPEHDTRLAQIIRRHFYRHLIPRQDADVVHAHLPGNVPQ